MDNYHEYLRDILENGVVKDDRTGVGTISQFGKTMRWDLQEGFPLVTTKRVWFKGVVEELLWMLRGETNIRPLVQEGVSIWTDWPLKNYNEEHERELTQEQFEAAVASDEEFALKWGRLGPVYGSQWRSFGGAVDGKDQIVWLLKRLENSPHSRRNLVSAWNPPAVENQALPPCHYAFQCWVSPDDKLSLMWQQRSVDSFLGLPFNIASYALLTHLLAAATGYEVGELIFNGGDCHIYQNHADQVEELLFREPRALPALSLTTRSYQTDRSRHTGTKEVRVSTDMKGNNMRPAGRLLKPW